MKKILSLFFVALAFLVVAYSQFSFATTEDDYYDLFYEIHEVEFSTSTTSSTTTIQDLSTDDAEFITNNRQHLISIETSVSPITLKGAGGAINVEVNFTELVSTYQGAWYLVLTNDYSGNNGSHATGTIRIATLDENNGNFVSSSVHFFNSSSSYLDESNVDFTLTFKIPKPWTKAYSYGRVRSSSSSFDLYHDESNEKVYLYNRTESGNVRKIDASTLTYDGAYAEPIVVQSPYSNFKFLTNEYEDVAAVWIQFIKAGSDYRADVKVYYWDDGELAVASKNELIHSNTGGFGNPFEFSGGYRSTISGDAVVIADVDNGYSLDHYLEFFKAWDDIDGDISDLIYVVEDDYTGNEYILGSYDVTIGVEDSEGNEATLEFIIMVVDVVEPTGPSTSSVSNISYTATYNLTDYITSYIRPNFTDNYDDASDLIITVKTDGYTATKSVPGNKTVIYSVKDTSGNESLHTLTIQVVDNVGPVFTGGLETLNKSVNETITTAQILATQVAMDAVDGNVSSSIIVVSNTYVGNETTPGSYEIIIRAFDSQNNQTTRSITIEVFSGVPSFWIPNDGPFIIPDGTTLTLEQIKNVLTAVQWIPMDVEVTLLSSDYFGNEETPGSYYITLSVGGTPVTFDLLVLNDGDNWFPDVPTPPVQAATPNFALIFGVSVGILAVTGIAAAVILNKKKKSKA